MNPCKHKMSGLTLLEILLVLAVMAAIVTLGMRAFLVFQRDTALQQLQLNVDNIMQAAAGYYYANCEKTSSNSGATLDPRNYNSSNPYPIALSTLVSQGFLAKLPPANPLVNNSWFQGGYLVQFNPQYSTRTMCTNGQTSCTTQVGTIVNYTIQVSVFLNNTSLVQSYQKMSDASCLTSVNWSYNQVFACSTATAQSQQCNDLYNTFWANYGSSSGAGFAAIMTALSMGCPPLFFGTSNYLSWERLPSMASPKAKSDYWTTNPVVKQFKQLYENNLTNSGGSSNDQYFLCGS